jgi:hypothetical protein
MATVNHLNTIGDLLVQLGNVSPDRVRLKPPVGTATKQDLIALDAQGKRLCELVDGMLVEKRTREYEVRRYTADMRKASLALRHILLSRCSWRRSPKISDPKICESAC